MNKPSIYLASGSPRRHELLRQIAINFEVIRPDVDETPLPDEQPKDYVQRLALEKAKAGWQLSASQAKLPVMGADTTVVLAGRILGKPENRKHAKQMLMSLSNQQHQVLTAVALVQEQQTAVCLSENIVRFTAMTEQQIDNYLATGEGDDKAGSYAVQGLAAQYIERIEGSFSGIMGLPLYETSTLLSQFNSGEAA